MDNILVISDFYDLQYRKDSGTPALRFMIEALAKEYEVYIILPRGNGQSEGNIHYYRVPLDPPKNVLASKLFWLRFNDLATRWAIELHHSFKRDFKLVYGAGPTSTHIAGKVGRKLNIPSVGRLFGTFMYLYIDNPIQARLRFEEFKAFRSNCDRFIITNDGTRGDMVASHFGIPESKVCFLRNGVEVPSLAPKTHSETLVRVISMARLEKWKHVARIVAAFRMAKAKNANLVLDIIGDGPEYHHLVKISKDAQIRNAIFFRGEVPREQALSFLNQSDIFITANDYSNVSNSLMEAMALGKIVIALDTGGTSEIIKHLINGYLVSDTEGLSDAIIHAADWRNPYNLGAHAKAYAQENFEPWSSRIEKEVALCKELIK